MQNAFDNSSSPSELALYLNNCGQPKYRKVLYRLLTESQEYQAEKFAQFGTNEQYLSEIDLALDNFQDPLPTNQIVTFFQLHTARQVIQQQTNANPDDALQLLVELKRVKEAIGYARLRNTAADRFKSLLRVANVRKKSGDLPFDMLSELEQTVWQIEDPEFKSRALGDLAEVFAELDEAEKTRQLFNEALQVASTIQRAFGRSLTLGMIVKTLCRIGLLDEAVALIDQIEDDEWRDWSREEIIQRALARSNFSFAFDMVKLIQDPEIRVSGFQTIISDLDLAHHELTRDVFFAAIDAANEIPYIGVRIYMLCQLINFVPSSISQHEIEQLIQQTLSLRHLLQSSDKKTKALSALSSLRFHYDEWNDVFKACLESFDVIEDHDEHKYLLVALAIDFRYFGRFDALEQLVDCTEEEHLRAEVQTELYSALLEVGNFDRATVILEGIPLKYRDRALKIMVRLLSDRGEISNANILSRSISDQQTRVESLYEISNKSIQTNAAQSEDIFDEASKSMLNKRDDARWNNSLITIVKLLINVQEFNGAILIAKKITQPLGQVEMLRHIGLYLAKNGSNSYFTLLSQARNIANKSFPQIKDWVETWFTRGIAIAHVRNNEEHAADSVNNAKVAAYSFKDKTLQAQYLCELAQDLIQIGANQYINLLDDVTKIIVTVPDESARIRLFKSVAVTYALIDSSKSSVLFEQAIELVLCHSVDSNTVRMLAQEIIQYENTEKGRRLLSKISEPFDQVQTLCQLIKNTEFKNQVDDLIEKAVIAAQAVKIPNFRVLAFCLIATELINVNHVRAIEILQTAENNMPPNPDSEFKHIANVLATLGSYVDAFKWYRRQRFISTGSLPLDDLMTIIQDWYPVLENLDPFLPLIIIRESARIAGWIRPDWHEVYRVLAGVQMQSTRD
ncbi:MAG: hypothetical protein H6670_10815 [Anaerolineaceae bacterium]|nr:hypothetical protein [Anaerolineaceae bacterium]